MDFRKVLHRLAPSVFRDPNEIIGRCQYCDADVTYSGGDIDAQGNARHEQCWEMVRGNQLLSMKLSAAYGRAILLLASEDLEIRNEIAKINDELAHPLTLHGFLTFLRAAQNVLRIKGGTRHAETQIEMMRAEFLPSVAN